MDGRDFLAWQRGFGISTGATPADGDANGDQAVDALDLGIWQQNYGTSSLLAALAAVESTSVELPASELLAALISDPLPTLSSDAVASLIVADNSLKGFLVLPTVGQPTTGLLSRASESTGESATLASGVANDAIQPGIQHRVATSPPSEFSIVALDQESADLGPLALAWDQFADEMVQGVTEAFSLARSPRSLRRWLRN
jgi:hypothetical protein